MSPRVQVRPLSFQCIKLISTRLIFALSEYECRNHELIQCYMSAETREVLEDLLKDILNSANLDAATRFSCLQVLLREDVIKLETGIFPHSYYTDILKVVAEKGCGIRLLNLKGVWVRDYPELLCKLIQSLSKLRMLLIPHMANDEVLDTILKRGSISVLDVSGETALTVGGLAKFNCNSLTVLDIGSFGKKDVCVQELEATDEFEVMAGLIERLPNLTSLRTYSFTGNALHYLYKKNNSKNQTKFLYLHDTGTSSEIMNTIIKICPNLKSLHLDSPAEDVVSKLACLKYLYCLTLTKFNVKELVNYLQTEHNVTILKLNHSKDTNLDLARISSSRIEILHCFQMKLSCSPAKTDTTLFSHLEDVEILYTDITDSALKCILVNTPLLKRIVVGSIINMTDGDVFRLCAECDFIYLEELWFSCARRLTATSVERLMGHCPSLRVIGQLSGWDVHQAQIDYLRSVIKQSNTDLTLLPLGPFRSEDIEG